jgi:hypothetical protein
MGEVAHHGGMESEEVIVVVGVGSARAVPDCIRAHAGVSVVADTVADALTAAGAAQQRIVEVLLASGVDRAAIRTTGYNVGRDYEGGERSRRHRADATFEVRLPDIGDAGEVFAAMGEAAGDALRIHGVHPEVSDPVPAQREARAAAVVAARARAEELAAAAGVTLGPLRSLVEGGGAQLPFHGGVQRVAMAAAAAPEVEPGRQDVQVAVTATYELAHA